MSDDTMTEQRPALEPKPEPAAEMETAPEADTGEDKPTPLPKLQGKENQLSQAEENKTESFKKPMDVKPQVDPEEAKFSAKYGKVKPGGSDFLRKRLNKGVKYFDSGDYNMEKQSGKRPGSGKPSGLRPGLGKPPGLAGVRLGGGANPAGAAFPNQSPLGTATGKTIPTPASIPHRKQSTEISKLAV